MGKGELEVLGDELLDVGALDVLGLLQLNDAEDLDFMLVGRSPTKDSPTVRRTWMDLKRARWRAAISA